jgi:hypothetical protein
LAVIGRLIATIVAKLAIWLRACAILLRFLLLASIVTRSQQTEEKADRTSHRNDLHLGSPEIFSRRSKNQTELSQSVWTSARYFAGDGDGDGDGVGLGSGLHALRHELYFSWAFC